MEDEHKDILLMQRVKLVENINVRGGLYTQLLARKVLTRRQIQNIKAARTVSEQTEELLDELEQSGSKAFDLFCAALKADHQEEIVNLYLKPPESTENKQDEKEKPSQCVEEVKPSISGSVIPCMETGTPNSPCPPNGSNHVVSDCGRLVPGMAVREEFEHQTYRRSIESSQLAVHNKPNLPPGSSLEHDAYYFYQNTLARPLLGYPDMNSPLKERTYLVQSEKDLSHLVNGDYRSNVYNVNVKHDQELQLLNQKGIASKEIPLKMMGNTLSNNNMPSYQAVNAHSPNVFNISSASSVASHSPLKLQGLNPFAFQKSDSLNSSSVQQTQEISSQEHLPPRSCNTIDSSYLKQNSTVLNSECVERYPMNGSPVKLSSPHGNVRVAHPQTQHGVERTCIEIPRYIEMNNPMSSQREMMALPHYIETAQIGIERADSPAERNVPRLVKNDSVDTMHKRPMGDTEEHSAKRSKEDPDCIQTNPVTMVTKVNQLKERILTVPIISEPQKRPSMPSVVIETESHQDMYQRGVLQGVMDDPEIDLTDGPIDVKVEHCTRQFYLANFKQSYSMRRIPRGKALILNVNEVMGKPPRRGTDIDRENLHNLLCQLHFDVTIYNDKDGLTAKEIVIKLQDFSQDSGHRTGESAVICILSHGEEGYIFGSDGKKFELEGAFSLFDNTSCPMLRGKPKIFIVQACRGGALDRGVQYYTDEHDGSDARLRQCPSMSDMLICYPTQNGYYAWRNRDRGSWYVEALVQVFMKYAKCEDICTMLNRVNLLVSKKVSNCPQIEMDQMSQMSEYKSTLRMPHLFFFPGIGTLM